jgi:hypothetical protein
MTKPKTSLAYCAGLDQMVRVVPGWELTGEPRPTNGGATDPSQLVCLEYGEGCTGAVCPLLQVPTEEMEARLVRIGLKRARHEEEATVNC